MAACSRAESPPAREFLLSPEAETELAAPSLPIAGESRIESEGYSPSTRTYPAASSGRFWIRSSNPANSSTAATTAIADPSHASRVTALRVV